MCLHAQRIPKNIVWFHLKLKKKHVKEKDGSIVIHRASFKPSAENLGASFSLSEALQEAPAIAGDLLRERWQLAAKRGEAR